MPLRVISCLLAWSATVVCSAAAEPAPPKPEAIAAQLPALLKALDASDYAERQRAEGQIEQWVQQPDLRTALAQSFQSALLDPQLSFEVRWHLQHWSRRLPAASVPPPAEVAPAEIDRLVAQLDDEQYSLRLGAQQRLEWLLRAPRMVCPILCRLRARLDDSQMPADSQRRLSEAWEKVRGAWLMMDPAQWQLPPLEPHEIERWVDDLASPPPTRQPGAWAGHRRAERELMFALARDEYVPRIRDLLKRRIAAEEDRAAVLRLDAVYYWTRPALVAEYWQNRHHLGEQHLLVGEPSQAETAVRPSHFDYIDDRVARCVSGNSLSPGEYPSGVAFPHPTQPAAFFQLVNLPTPLRRMRYEFDVKRDEARRLAEISHRTAQRWLEENRLLGEGELNLLAQLDAAEMSRFVGQYVNRVEDEPVLVTAADEPSPSRHGLLCLYLVRFGTKEAIPGLLEAIAHKRFLEPTHPPYRLPWCAALAIAQRDPWEKVDAWLAGLIERSELLRVSDDDGPELGATAAALLLSRHDRIPEALGLRSTGDLLGNNTRLEGFRFESPESRADVLRWWREEGPAPTGT